MKNFNGVGLVESKISIKNYINTVRELPEKRRRLKRKETKSKSYLSWQTLETQKILKPLPALLQVWNLY